MGVYCINAARYLFKAEPEEVFAWNMSSSDRRFAEVPEMTSGLLKFPKDRAASFTTSFGAADRDNMEVCFPSKLADYTVPALPLLVYAPPYSSAVEWAAANPGTAVTVSKEQARLAALLSHTLSLPADRAALWAPCRAADRRGAAEHLVGQAATAFGYRQTGQLHRGGSGKPAGGGGVGPDGAAHAR